MSIDLPRPKKTASNYFPPKVQALLALVGFLIVLLLGLAFPVGIYLAISWSFDLLSHPDVGWGYLAGGIGLMFVVLAVVSIMGESLIEDFLKLGLFVILAAVTGSAVGLPWSAVALGAPCGAAMPLLFRLARPPR